MRIYLHLTPNREIVPFNYQQNLVGAFHKWLGENELHDDISLYSLSWLGKGIPKNGGLNFPHGTTFFISSPLQDLHLKAVQGIFNGADIRWGMRVESVNMKITPDFGSKQVFLAQSPILIKRKTEGDQHYQYYFPSDAESNGFLTETLHRKLERAGLSTDVSVAFDSTYKKDHIKKIKYRGLDIKAAMCPVVVEGNPKAVQFAWEVGIGNSTGIGFGAMR
jgi:CRISPR-associated endoribonuclease Cas6